MAGLSAEENEVRFYNNSTGGIHPKTSLGHISTGALQDAAPKERSSTACTPAAQGNPDQGAHQKEFYEVARRTETGGLATRDLHLNDQISR